MSTSEDSCSDYHHRLESSKLLPLFEELQAVGFPVSVLERNIDKLKLGSASIYFIIYTHLYRTFRDFFIEQDRTLDQFQFNDRVVDREKFAQGFFAALREIIQHEQALSLYQYVCPGHPLSKSEEIANVSRKLRSVWRRRQRIKLGAGELDTRPDIDQKVERRAENEGRRSAQSSNNGVQRMYKAKIGPPEIPWQAVKASEAVSEIDGDAEDMDTGDAGAEDDESPDEGIRSWNASSVNRDPFSLRVPGSADDRSLLKQGLAEGGAMDKEDGIRTVLNRFDQIESHQSSRFRSIEEHLTRLERDLSTSNRNLHHGIFDRLDNHEGRITRLESPVPIDIRRRTSTSASNRSIVAAQEQRSSPVARPAPPTARSDRSPSSESPRKKNSDVEIRRPSTKQSNRATSLSRPQTSHGAIDHQQSLLRDSGFSSIHKLHNDPQGSAQEQKNNAEALEAARIDSDRLSTYFDPSREKKSAANRDIRANRKEGVHHGERRISRSQSVAPNILATNGFDSLFAAATTEKSNNETVLLDLNERIQLRLNERIKTAEDTLNACMETIRKDYVLVRRPT